MHTTIFYEASNDSSLSNPINTLLKQQFTSSNFSLFEIRKDEIKPCIGCFGCWLKTPGKCLIQNDIVAKTNPCFVQSDYVVVVSSIHYGSYSAATKRIIDRVTANLLPFFRKYKNEMHHETRYPHMAKQIILAYGEDLTPAEKETFLKLTKANATNLAIDDPDVFFCQSVSEIQEILNTIQTKLQTA